MELIREAAAKAADANDHQADDYEEPTFQAPDLDSGLDTDFGSDGDEAPPPLQKQKSKYILKDAMKFIEWSNDEFQAAIQNLDSDQLKVFKTIENQCKKITSKECYPTEPPPLHMFCSGSAG